MAKLKSDFCKYMNFIFKYAQKCHIKKSEDSSARKISSLKDWENGQTKVKNGGYFIDI